MSLVERINEFKQICGIVSDDETTNCSPTTETEVKVRDRHNEVDETEVTESTDATTVTSYKLKQQQLVNVIEQPKKMIGGVMKSY